MPQCFLIFFLLLTLMLNGMAPSGARAQTTDIRSAFRSFHTQTVWPVVGNTIDATESTFGPRIKSAARVYDWHRGIDIDAPRGTPVVAAVRGELWQIATYMDGGITVLLRHSFPTPVTYLGRTLRWYYTLYMHLNSVRPELVSAIAAGQHPILAPGTLIGTVGQTGTTVIDHLHFELRIGTWCSLEFQLQNPLSSCAAGFGFDPHVHPLWLYAPRPSSMSAALLVMPTGGQDGRVRFASPDEQPLLNRIEYRIVERSTAKVVASHVLDFNLRLGYNASTNAALDTVNYAKPYIHPQWFTNDSTVYTTDVVIPRGFTGISSGSRYLTTITFRDIWGNAITKQW